LVLEAIYKANLRIKPSKCSWFSNKIALLGHIVCGTGVAMDPAKVDAINNRPVPRTVKQVQEFLGLTNYYRKFIKDYAKIARPLFELTRKDTPFEWNELREHSFKELKLALISYPVLRQPELQKPFTLYTDASGFALGAVLTQRDDNNNEYVCAYASRVLKGAEIHYSISEKKCLGLVWAIKYFRVYLFGSRFSVVTDHAALNWLMGINDATGRLCRWAIMLQNYEFDIVHRAGAKHQNADALSRPPPELASVNVITRAMNNKTPSIHSKVQHEPPVSDQDVTSKYLDVHEDEALKYYLINRKHVKGKAKKHVRRVEMLDREYVYKNKTIYHFFRGSWLEVPHPNERTDIVVAAHRFGHFQVEPTLLRNRETYDWKGIKRDVEKVVATCKECLEHHRVVHKEHPVKALPITGSNFD
jgi:hypothetical protein